MVIVSGYNMDGHTVIVEIRKMVVIKVANSWTLFVWRLSHLTLG